MLMKITYKKTGIHNTRFFCKPTIKEIFSNNFYFA